LFATPQPIWPHVYRCSLLIIKINNYSDFTKYEIRYNGSVTSIFSLSIFIFSLLFKASVIALGPNHASLSIELSVIALGDARQGDKQKIAYSLKLSICLSSSAPLQQTKAAVNSSCSQAISSGMFVEISLSLLNSAHRQKKIKL
jgi:hypothetical protein